MTCKVIHILFTFCGIIYVNVDNFFSCKKFFYPLFCLTLRHLSSTINMLFSNNMTIGRLYIFKVRKEEVYQIWRWRFSRRRDPDLRFMDSDPEWVLRAEEKFWQQDEQKEDINYPHRSQQCDLFFSVKDRSEENRCHNGIFGVFKKKSSVSVCI